jgi:hypothetical protein
VYITKSLSDLEKSIFTEAATEWYNATNGIARFIVVYDKEDTFPLEMREKEHIDLVVVRAVPANSFIVWKLDLLLQGEMLGLCDIFEDPTTLYLVPERFGSLTEYKTVIMHELGHALMGMGHLDEEGDYGSLMVPAYDGKYNCITKKDLDWFCDVYNCDSSKMKYCSHNIKLTCNYDD